MRPARCGARDVSIIAAGVALGLAAWSLAGATGGVYTATKHGNPTTGIERRADEARGDCGQCHEMHASRDGVAQPGPYVYALFAANDNQLCSTNGCHPNASPLGVYPGRLVYDASAHETSTSMVWPGPVPRARTTASAGYCVNCHTPHGRKDATGTIPSLLSVREEASCDTCHDGSPASTNIAADVAKTYRHPMTSYNTRHQAAENAPAAFGTTNRHAECEDCHNPHDARRDTLAPDKPVASNRNQRVSRVQVVNGAAGAVPTYTFRPASDSGSVREFEICFKCHSSWTTQPVGQGNYAVVFNANNPSFHPVEAAGKNLNVLGGAFVSPWTASTLTYCADCHGSDGTTAPRGSHGSANRYILKKPYTASPASRTMSANEICFLCHAYDTYANNASPSTVKGYSRFNPPTFSQGHTYHVGSRRYPCYACHQTHGSTTQPFLIATGRNPGISSYTRTANGGTCSPTCHGSESYTVNYAR